MTVTAEFITPASEQGLLRAILRGGLRLFFRSLVRPPMPIAGQRAVLRMLTAISPPPAGVVRSAGTLAGRGCEWHRPACSSGTVLLYLHGGAYLIGGPNTHRAICAHLAKRGQMDVCALDYRLAPEHPYPAAREDAVAAFQALIEQGYKPEQIVIGGDSAGGNLSLITSLYLRDQGLPQPAALVCFSPVTDFTGEHIHQPPAGDPLLCEAWMHQAVSLYCPADVQPGDPGVSPQYADLTGLAPLLIQVGEDELLRNDSLRFAEKAQEAGVEVQLQRYVDLWHVFQAHAGLLKVADRALADVVSFIRARGC
ncbi:alpha/beta hydrolase [Pseudomonas sp. TTU2014-080ASC]|uniref:alpha/beta hydrolase n=1 Tax=Pseudomonas sp. TTU2014-080ASC TaxID=1729724 RepID=UPI0007187FF0|nr:alpha/beta hydrolase [Pseudomonas sp. TTU2014-080ASC]KRW59919.1 alpha/beta hydrolase [Pseudomonas sp. TTU2014-080ASC]